MTIQSYESEVIITEQIASVLKDILKGFSGRKIFVLTDENSLKHCFPVIKDVFDEVKTPIVIKADDENKNIQAVTEVWTALQQQSADRKSLLINLGGGMVCDLGGFAAATFKRGIEFINIPTTLLAQVDASVGGKVGINFNSLKNEIGVFKPASKVLVDTTFLKTLDKRQIVSGFAEMLKHALILDESYWHELTKIDLYTENYSRFTSLIEKSIRIKNNFVMQDVHEKGVRKVLNFGHTIGHAFESFSFESEKPLLHGEAVAAGMVCELYLSTKRNFDVKKVHTISDFIIRCFGKIDLQSANYETLFELMTHDKKNSNGIINFTILTDIAQYKFNESFQKSEIFEALEFYRTFN